MNEVLLRNCPFCGEEIRAEAIKCRFCRSRLDSRGSPRDWYRSSGDRMLAGVCGGLAEQFDVPTALLRLGFLLSALFMGGVGIVLYVALWVIMPQEEWGSRRDDAEID